jgi:ABC-type lipoprotein release transport system permease subunit
MALGLAGAFAMTRILTVMLYGVSPTDAFTFFVVPLLLGLVAVAACLIPAARAARTEPIVALRE